MFKARLTSSVLVLSSWMTTFARADEGEKEPSAIYETVVTATPLHGSRLPRDHVPANVQSVSARDLAEHHSLDLSSYLDENVGSIHINDVQGNPLQPDLQYRGFLASPLLGAPQGLSLYLDGVRLNEPFGDTINWDLVPSGALRSANLIPGSNPIFGLNTLGGALSLETKTGFSDPGAQGTLLYGSWGRKIVRANAGAHNDKFAVFAAAQAFDESGWRDNSPSRSASALLSTTYAKAGTLVDLVLIGASTRLTGNGAAPEQLLALDRRAVFTSPDRTDNHMFAAILRAERPLSADVHLSGTAFVRTNRTRSLNGDQHDWAECMGAPGTLCSTDDNGKEVPVADQAGNPVAFSPEDNGTTNHSDTGQTSYGLAGQLASDAPVARRENHFFAGIDASQGRIRFRSQSTVARLDDSRRVLDTGFLDPASPIAVDSVVTDLGLYASDTLALRPDLFVVLSGRFNRASLALQDQREDQLGDQLGDQLTGHHQFLRVNLAGGLSYQPRSWLGAYVSYNESSRAPTAVELTCASPAHPCRLPNAFVADPPLAQVVARTFEIGVRGVARRAALTLDYHLTGFRTTNSNDILFIGSGMVASQGYFANVGETRRQGVEADVSGHRRVASHAQVNATLHYTLTDATFETPFTALSVTHPQAVNGLIDVPAGSRIPSIPRHLAKLGLGVLFDNGLSGGANLVMASSQSLRGDEANLLAPIPGHTVVNLRLAYRFWSHASAFVMANNVFDAHGATFGVLGNATQVLGPTYDSPRFLGPGAPRAAWLGFDFND